MPFSDNVSVLQADGREIYIVGTAHISRQSAEEVDAVIEAVRPETVCVELDQNRYDALTDEERWKNLDVFQVIRQRKVSFLLVNLALAGYQRRLGEKLGVQPGAEMLAAIRKAEQIGAELALVDRDIQITLKRTWRSLSFWGKIRLLGAVAGGVVSEDELTEERIEEIKRGESLADMMQEFAKQLPQVKRPLIDERDAYMISRVSEAPGRKVVAVVGAAHVPGMLAQFGQGVDRRELETLPPAGRLLSLLKWLLPTLVLAAFYIGYRKHAGEGLYEMVWAWLVPNAVFASVFSLLAGARMLSALTAFVASPITSLNPTIAAGMIVGLVEAWLRRPTVEDCQRIREDAQTVRGLFRNRFTRVLLVSVAASLGSALGAWVGGTWVLMLIGR
ncbi:MAG: TraB/GumN family protein [Acidobacteriota bacterium]|nr:MAG: TraB/GumN family protein [Acidobacteriota bacterium]